MLKHPHPPRVRRPCLRHQNIVGYVQQGRGGTPTWEKAVSTEQRHMMVMEVRHQEEAARHASAFAQTQQGQWVRWDGIVKRKITWCELWNMKSNLGCFIIRVTYEVLPSPANLHLWLGEDPACPPNAVPSTLRHILVGCKISLTKIRYTWCQNQVLRCLASALEHKRMFGRRLSSQSQLPSSEKGR